MFTASTFILATYTLISIIILILGRFILSFFIEEEYLQIALEILPFSLISLVINALGSVVSSCLDGIQRNYIKSYIVASSSILLFVLSILFTPHYGLKGLIFAQIIQAIFALILSLALIAKYIPNTISLKYNWSRKIFKEILNYGMKMQVLSFMQMSYDPITKGLLMKFGGLAMVGYYEMANRLVSQLRSIIVSANQVIIPVVAEAQEKNSEYIKKIYTNTFSVIFILNIILTSCIVICVPIISELWIGNLIPFFIYTVLLNSIAVFINISTNPAYFNYLGEGKLNWIIYSCIFIAGFNLIFGYTFGKIFDGYGVVFAWNLAFSLGSLIVMFSYHKINRIKFANLLFYQDFRLFLLSIIYSVSGYKTIYSYLNGALNYWYGIVFIISLALFFKWLLENKHLLKVIVEFKKILVRKNNDR
jgi:O-antigen/teichoic acid export membrane protein